MYIEVNNLVKHFGAIKAVDEISFSIEEGEIFGLVGESGSGKSTTGKLLLHLIKPDSGEVLFRGQNIFKITKEELRRLRERVQIVFQDPYASLNPRMTIGEIVSEPIKIHRLSKGDAVKKRVDELLSMVGLKRDFARHFPHEVSGGECQRVGIARALSLNPEFIVLDEPVSSLDPSIQAQILNLLKDLKKELKLTYLFIAHDLSVVEYLCDRVAVMKGGKIVELSSTDTIFNNPSNPYTKTLLESIPSFRSLI